MSVPFHERRRQQFLTEAYSDALQKHFASSYAHWSAHDPQADSPSEARSLAADLVAEDTYMLFSLRYTAGIPISTLRTELTSVVEAYERYQRALADYEQVPQVAPLGLGNLGDYERCMQLIGLCYLLHRRDLLPRIAALEDPGYRGEDALYEDLLCYALPDRVETDIMLHLDVYDPLLGAMYGETDEACAQQVNEYVNAWYASFKYIPWHNGHLRIDGTEGDYFGYWAFEAGAVALLCDLDDSSITHMVYPKDLVAWARQNKHLSESTTATASGERLRCEAGNPCPREGWWFTPAKQGSRRHFQQGEVMPAFSTDYGSTIWQWDQRQGA